MLKSNPRIQRFLISSPSKFVGEFVRDNLVISHAWNPATAGEPMVDSGAVRHYFVMSAKVQDQFEEDPYALPLFSVDTVLVCLSVLFGKRFDNHGPLEQHGHFVLPDLGVEPPIVQYRQGFVNRQRRENFGTSLNLENLKIMAPLLEEGQCDTKLFHIFYAAGGAYVRALQTYERNPESAYLELITCGEILSSFYEYSDDEMYDMGLLETFGVIETQLKEGLSIVRNLKGRLFQVKRRFVRTIMRLLTSEFFEGNESDPDLPFGALDQESIEKRVKAAYDVRSSYIHSGTPFGFAISYGRTERQLGILADKQLSDAPTFKGLERIMRFCLIQFLISNKVISNADVE